MEKSKLESLYESIHTLENLGLALTPEMNKKADDLEEQLIKDEILPVLSRDIQPALSKIQRKLVLVVEYTPGSLINVALSRKIKISELNDTITLEQDPIVQHSVGSKHSFQSSRSPKKGLCIFLPNGTFIQEKAASKTMSEAIKLTNILEVRKLGIKINGVPLVSTTKDIKYNQQKLPGGLYLITHCDTKSKKKILEKISKSLNLDWKIDIID